MFLKDKKGSTSWLALLMGGLAFVPALGQANSDTVETVVVTGTLIRGVEKPVGSNLITLAPTDIKAAGANQAADLLDVTVPQVSQFNGLQTGSSSWASPTSMIWMRGVPYGTLLLFNGHRVTGMGILQTLPDPNLIPSDVIQSVQVMPDGGSATYGADTVGGVINFVTRTSFDGIQVHASDSIADHYNEFSASVTIGTTWKGGGAYISALHTNHNAIFGRDRDYDTVNFTSHGGPDYRSTSCGYGSFTVGGSIYTAPDYHAVSAAPRCDPTDNSSLYPEEARNSAFGYVTQQLTNSLKFSMDAFWAKRTDKIYIDMATIPMSATIDSSNPYWHPIGSETSQTIAYNYSHGLGTSRISPQDFTQYQVAPVLTWDVDGNWEARLSLNYGETWATVHDRSGLNGSMLTATNVNPYDTAQMNSVVLADLANYELYSQGINTQLSAQLIADGAIMTLPGGDVHVAFGGEIRRESLRDTSFNGPIGSFAGVGVYPAGRTIAAGFAEALIPIVGAKNAVPGVQKLSLNLAVRYDHYSDAGGTTNPRIGIDYSPIDDLTIRTNFQTTFIAPNLADDGDKVDTRLQVLSLSPTYFLIFIAGSGDHLKPETGSTFSVGADYSPHFIDGLDLGLTYWNTTLKNTVDNAFAYGWPGAQSTPYNVCGDTSPSGACTAAYLNSIKDRWLRLDNSGAPSIGSIGDLFKPGNAIMAVIDARRGNFGAQKFSGLDFNAAYNTDVSFGRLFAQFGGSYYLTNKRATVMGMPYQDKLSGAQLDGVSPYHLMASVGAMVGPYTARVSLTHNAEYNLSPASAVYQKKVGSFTVASMYLNADLGALAVMKENELDFTIDNLFDTNPPYFIPTSAPSLGANSTATGYGNGGTLGRKFVIGIRSKF